MILHSSSRYYNYINHLFSSSQNLRDLVPMDLLRAYTPDDWRKAITSHYSKHKSRAAPDAKIAFLKYISQWPTFGSAFFEVKVCCNCVCSVCVLLVVSSKRHSVHYATNPMI